MGSAGAINLITRRTVALNHSDLGANLKGNSFSGSCENNFFPIWTIVRYRIYNFSTSDAHRATGRKSKQEFDTSNFFKGNKFRWTIRRSYRTLEPEKSSSELLTPIFKMWTLSTRLAKDTRILSNMSARNFILLVLFRPLWSLWIQGRILLLLTALGCLQIRIPIFHDVFNRREVSENIHLVFVDCTNFISFFQ